MSIIKITFLFDYNGFGKRIAPALDGLRNGNYHVLQKLANEVAQEHPEVWQLLSNLYYPSIVNKVWDYPNNPNESTAFWINLLICRYSLQLEINGRIPKPAPEMLTPLGVDEKLIETLTWGKPISDLLQSLTTLDNTQITNPFQNLHFSVGWLSIENIENIKFEMTAYKKQSNHPACEDLLNILNTAIMARKGLILGVVM
jgi:hypothetical protein